VNGWRHARRAGRACATEAKGSVSCPRSQMAVFFNRCAVGEEPAKKTARVPAGPPAPGHRRGRLIGKRRPVDLAAGRLDQHPRQAQLLGRLFLERPDRLRTDPHLLGIVQNVKYQRGTGRPDQYHLPMAPQHHSSQGPALVLCQRVAEDTIAGDDARGGEELATQLALGRGKLREKVWSAACDGGAGGQLSDGASSGSRAGPLNRPAPTPPPPSAKPVLSRCLSGSAFLVARLQADSMTLPVSAV
jgi:hypothetical protein